MEANLIFEIIKPTELDDACYIELYDENTLVGKVVFEQRICFDYSEKDFELEIDSEHIYLNKIWVHPMERQKGYGNMLMNKFLEIVPKNNMILLYPSPFDFGLKLSVLIKFYEKFGFDSYDEETLFMFKYV